MINGNRATVIPNAERRRVRAVSSRSAESQGVVMSRATTAVSRSLQGNSTAATAQGVPTRRRDEPGSQPEQKRERVTRSWIIREKARTFPAHGPVCVCGGEGERRLQKRCPSASRPTQNRHRISSCLPVLSKKPFQTSQQGWL